MGDCAHETATLQKLCAPDRNNPEAVHIKPQRFRCYTHQTAPLQDTAPTRPHRFRSCTNQTATLQQLRTPDRTASAKLARPNRTETELEREGARGQERQRERERAKERGRWMKGEGEREREG